MVIRDYERLQVSLKGEEDDELWIALSNPGNRNVIDGKMHEELAVVFRDVREVDPRVVILTGAGDTFSPGGDLNWMQESWLDDPADYIEVFKESKAMIEDLIDVRQPVIARVNGDCVGLGATLALHCDIVIAEQGSKLGDPHVKIGLAAGDGGATIWPLLTSFNKAKEYLMTGELMTTEEAEEFGLVNYAVPPGELDAKVDEMVDKLTSLPQPAVQYSKMAANGWLRLVNDIMLRQSLAMEGISTRSPDHTEAVAAFLEGRGPDLETARKQDQDTE